jgi:predicted O-linked N-acetylglucosamine transferase (SPINDLY family)
MLTLLPADGAFGEDKQLQAEFRELVQAEMETAKALLKGKAIKEHMEDSYCEMVAVTTCIALGSV